MRPVHLLATLVLASATLAAHADSFVFNFGGASTPLRGSGILTTGTMEAPGEYSIASLSGTASTLGSPTVLTSSLLTAGTFPTIANGNNFPANDNVLFVTNGVGSFDGYGLSLLLSNGTQINFYNPSGSTNNTFFELPSSTTYFANLPVSITPAAATPEPSSIALFATGLLGAAGAVRRRLSM